MQGAACGNLGHSINGLPAAWLLMISTWAMSHHCDHAPADTLCLSRRAAPLLHKLAACLASIALVLQQEPGLKFSRA